MTLANASVTVTRMLQTKFEVNMSSSFREEDDCWRMTTDAGISPFDTNSSPWAFGSGELKSRWNNIDLKTQNALCYFVKKTNENNMY
jgi:hypothetical protein